MTREWTPIEHPAELRRQRRARAAKRQQRIDTALAVAIGVVMIALVAFALGAVVMVAGWEMFG